MNVIRGYSEGGWEHSYVTFDGYRLDPRPSQQVFNHSPDGFAWGYGGSGPAQLALAILLAAGVPDDDAVRLHQDFKDQYIARLPQNDGWQLDLDVAGWAAEKLAAA